MKKLVGLFSLFICLSAMGATYYVAPNGSDGNSGSISQPFATLNKAWTVVSAGDVIYLRGGTYYFRSQQILTGENGSAGNLIKVWAYPGEKPTLSRHDSYDFDYSCGIFFRGNYVHFKGIEITGYRQLNVHVWSGLWVENSSNNIFEMLDIHHNGHGLFIRGNSDNNLVLNSDFHQNSDPLTDPEYDNADGLQLAFIPAGNTNTVRGCRFWWNSDDGVDLWRNEGEVIFESCWSWYNGYLPDTYTHTSEGLGFKYGVQTESREILRTTTNCLAFMNRAAGYGDNGAICNMVFYNNIAYKNGRSGGWGGGFELRGHNSPYYIKNNIAYDNIPDEEDIDNTSNESHNSWNGGVTVTNDDFVSLDETQLFRARNSDGSLPDIDFLRLKESSDLIDAGTNVGLPYNGDNPDLGAFEYGTYTPPPIHIPVNTGIDFDEVYPKTIDLYFDIAINSQIVPSVSNFTVVFNGSTNLDVASINITEFEVRVILENPINASGTLSVSYSKTGSNLLQSWAGGEVESFTAQTSVSIDSPPPPEEELTVRIFPSPVGEYITIHILGTPITTSHFIRFYDTSGELIYEGTLKTNASNIPISFPAGVYLVDIGLGNEVLYSQRIVLN